MQYHIEYSLVKKVTFPSPDPHQSVHRSDALAAKQAERKARLDRIRFYRLYRLRNLLFRFAPGLADRLAL